LRGSDILSLGKPIRKINIQSSATHTKDFCEKNACKSPDFSRGNFSEIAIFFKTIGFSRPHQIAGFFFKNSLCFLNCSQIWLIPLVDDHQ
jgi:hypothetical protein